MIFLKKYCNFLWMAGALFFGACNQQSSSGGQTQAVTANDKALQDKNGLEWQVNEISKKGENIRFALVNHLKSEQPVLVYEPMQVKIFKEKGSQWVKMKIKYCHCGDECPPPPEQMEMYGGQSLQFQWDQREETCDGQKPVFKQAGSGTFQIQVEISKGPDAAREVLSKTFRIE